MPAPAGVRDAVTHLDSYIAACQLGITVASLALGWIGELAPKGVALQYPEPVALAVAGPLRLFRALFRPIGDLGCRTGLRQSQRHGQRERHLEDFASSEH